MLLNFHRVPDQIEQLLQREAKRRRQAVDQVALEALERGLTSTPDPNPAPAEDDATWVENPQFEAALQEFAQMETTR